jgi:peptidyl-prolyl cis-trans isomerase B (cyclophilin B)
MIRKVLRCAVKIFFLAGALSLTACVQEQTETPFTPDNDELALESQNEETQPEAEANLPAIPPMPVREIPDWRAPDDLDNPDQLPVIEGPVAHMLQTPARMLQLEPLTPGEELAILHTNKGDITIRFFPEEAPVAVTTFKAHARNGYYDGLLFHRVIPNFMIQGGCPLGTGTGGESVWGGRFDTEISLNLRHFRGALAMAHAGPGTIGSQFYIVQNNNLDNSFVEMFEDYKNHLDEVIGMLPDGTVIRLNDLHPIEGINYFLENGGTPHLDWLWNQRGPHPVFAHVVEGMDVVDAIANTPQGANNRPTSDMIIERISFVIYGQ